MSYGDSGPVQGAVAVPHATNFVNSATEPASPYAGLLWYDQTVNTFKQWSGTSWVTVQGGDGAPIPPLDGRIYAYVNGVPVDITDSLIDPPV